MSRWHEPGCKRPLVTSFDNTVCCTHCFAFASVSPNADNIVPAILLSDTVSRNDDGKSQLEPEKLVKNCKRTPFSEIDRQNQFRLLRISSGHHSASIHASVEVACTGDSLRPSYDILSYARVRSTADQVDWRAIYVGQYWDAVFIPKLYEDLFRVVRDTETDRDVWMECLCVDGADVEEKTCQTRLIPQILRGASRTLVCLGSEAIEDYDVAFDFLSSFEPPKSAPVSPASVSARNSRSVKSLMKHDYFTTIQAIREVVLSKTLMIIHDKKTLILNEAVSDFLISYTSAPRWLRGPTFRYHHTARDTLSLLTEVASYFCRDHREKVYVLLALFHMGDTVIDYGVSLEQIFISVAIYLIRHDLLHEILSIATTQERHLYLPSWVPDWSTAMKDVLSPAPEPKTDTNYMDVDDKEWDEDDPIKFLPGTGPRPSSSDDPTDTRLTLSMGNRLCSIKGSIVESHTKYTKLRINRGAAGTLVITCAIVRYEPGPDFVFLPSSMTAPVLIRYDSVRDSYSVICTCTVGRGPPIDGAWAPIPWDDPTLMTDTIRVSRTSPDELNLMRNFHTGLTAIYGINSAIPQQELLVATTSSAPAEAPVMNFLLLSVMGLFDFEATLRDGWTNLDQELGWMLLDQQALASLVQEIDIGIHEPISGNGILSCPGSYFASCGMSLPLSYDWNLAPFCHSFVTRPATVPSEVPPQNLMLSRLRKHLPEIREWAAISAQLVLLFEYSRSILGDSWPGFPGNSLVERWRDLHRAASPAIYLAPHHEHSGWDWADFRSTLQLRSNVWSRQIPPQLRLRENKNLATQLSLRCLGLDLAHRESIVLE